MVSGSFGDTLDLLRHYDGDESLLAEVITRSFPVSGATITLGGSLPGSTVSATGRLAALLDEVQLDLGEGPIWDALKTMAPIIVTDLPRGAPSLWPAFADTIADEELGAIFVFPMRFGRLLIGTVTLYSDDPVGLFVDEIGQMVLLTDMVGRLMMRASLERAAEGGDIVPERFSRRTIHQAVGMIIVQADVSAEDAELLIRGHAFAEKASMHDVAADILKRRLEFDPVTMWGEDR